MNTLFHIYLIRSNRIYGKRILKEHNLIWLISYLALNLVVHTVYNMLLTKALKKTNIYILYLLFTYDFIYLGNVLIFIKVHFSVNNSKD